MAGLILGCQGTPATNGAPDGGRDAFVTDGLLSDATPSDLNSTDAPIDAAVVDAAVVDAAVVDAPVVDAAVVDALLADLSSRDASGPALDAPRPVAPVSLGDVTQRRPTLRWVLPSGADGAVVELCRDRACAMVIETLTVTGGSARPSRDLPARSVVFWRMRSRVGDLTATVYSPTWLFHVPAVSASEGVDTSYNPHLDLNADGFDDVVIAAPNADPGGRMNAGAVSVFHGSASGVSTTPARVIEGVAVEDMLGGALAGAGDVNGDGYGDLLVGTVWADPGGRDQAGAVSVFHGSASGISMTPARVIEGSTAEEWFGHTVACAGDVNGDGFSDILVGAVSAGTVSLFHGSSSGVSSTPARVLTRVAPADAFSAAIASAGDLNGDGFGDIVIGAPSTNVGGRAAAGAVYVFHGSASGLAMAATRTLEGGAMTDSLGGSVACAGDVNGDGYTDLVLGAPFASPNGQLLAGQVSVHHGGASGLSVTPARVYAGETSYTSFGRDLAGVGDVNGDGFSDLAITAPRDAPGGRVYVYLGGASGPAATPARLLDGAAESDGFGDSLAGAGDVNGDGYADIVVGAAGADPAGRQFAGAASVFHGSASGIPTTPARVIEGLSAYDSLGETVAR